MKSAISSGTRSSQIDTLVVDGNNITDPKTLSFHLASFFKTIIGSLREEACKYKYMLNFVSQILCYFNYGVGCCQ